MLYFAYGSNMNSARMAKRVPCAVCKGTATLYGWRLRERLYADIERADGERVDGVLWEIGERGLEALDRYEGYPTVYDGGLANVWKRGAKRPVKAYVYYMTEHARAARARLPFPDDYRLICAEGAYEHGLSQTPWLRGGKIRAKYKNTPLTRTAKK